MYGIADLHGEVKCVTNWIESMEPHYSKREEKLLVLGDAGMNYQLDKKDYVLKNTLQNAINQAKNRGITIELLFVRGNHECRPENVGTYERVEKYGDIVYVEKDFPNLMFLKDGGIYSIDDNSYIVIGGGFSDDFFDRLLNGYGIWADQELSAEEFQAILDNPNLPGNFTVLSHVAPSCVSQQIRQVDTLSLTEKNLQRFFEKYHDRINGWLLGHYHMERRMDYRETEFHVFYHNIQQLR